MFLCIVKSQKTLKKKPRITPYYKRKKEVGITSMLSVKLNKNVTEKSRIVQCAHCGIPIKRKPSQLKKTENSFCCISHEGQFYGNKKRLPKNRIVYWYDF